MNDKLRAIVIVAVTVVWALNVTVPIFVKDYESIPELNATFMGLVGIIIAGRKNGGGDDNSDSSSTNELAERRSARGSGDTSDSA